MKYYIFKISATADRPDWFNYDERADREINQHSLGYFELPKYTPVFSSMVLDLRKPKTDFLLNYNAVSGKGFICNQKAISVIELFNILNSRVYKLKVLQSVRGQVPKELDNPPEYFYLQIVSCNFWEWIDLENSDFFIYDDLSDSQYDISFKSLDELKQKYNSLVPLEKIRYRKLVLNRTFAALNADMFYFHELQGSSFPEIIISDRIKIAIEKANLTGLDQFNELNIQAE